MSTSNLPSSIVSLFSSPTTPAQSNPCSTFLNFSYALEKKQFFLYTTNKMDIGHTILMMIFEGFFFMFSFQEKQILLISSFLCFNSASIVHYFCVLINKYQQYNSNKYMYFFNFFCLLVLCRNG